VLKMADRAPLTAMCCATVRLLHEVMSRAGLQSAAFCELALKCNWKMIKAIQPRKAELSLQVLLTDLQALLQAYNMQQLKEHNHKLMMTVNTLLHTLCKSFGQEVLSALEATPGAYEGGELYRAVCKTLKKQQGEAAPLQAASPKQGGAKRSARVMDLAEIFRKIGSRENTKEGLVELYDFLEKHPDTDLNPFLAKSSQFFQNYIDRGLKSIKQERESNPPVCNIPAAVDSNSNGPSQYDLAPLVDQFKSIASEIGYTPSQISSAVSDICDTRPRDYRDIVNEYKKDKQ